MRDEHPPATPPTNSWDRVGTCLRAAVDEKTPGHLSTILEDDVAPGFPFGSLVPFALDVDDRPIIVISELAVHTHNLRRDPRASLTVAEPGGDPQRGWRLTLVGSFHEENGLKARYASTHELWNLPGFHAFVLTPTAARLIVGFGAMAWLKPPAVSPSI